jgi:ribosomal-protein-alanine N-acetyltransferase
MHLLNITIAPSARRHGHARRLLAGLVQVCRERAAGRLWLEVRESNVLARGTYRHLGFEEVGRRKGYYPAAEGGREDAIVMSLDVTAPGLLDALD